MKRLHLRRKASFTPGFWKAPVAIFVIALLLVAMIYASYSWGPKSQDASSIAVPGLIMLFLVGYAIESLIWKPQNENNDGNKASSDSEEEQ